MIPSIDERLASVVRALSEVILPHLPPEASLAQEQVHLAVGHLQILRAQIDAAPAFEREELDDAIHIGQRLHAAIRGGAATAKAVATLAGSIAAADGADVRGQTRAIHQAIQALVRAVAIDGDKGAHGALSAEILKAESARSHKDRQWCAPFGFDQL